MRLSRSTAVPRVVGTRLAQSVTRLNSRRLPAETYVVRRLLMRKVLQSILTTSVEASVDD